MKNKKLFYVLSAIVLGAIAGKLTGTETEVLGVPYYDIYSLIGKLYLNALMLVVVPLVSASIITGTAKMGGEHSFGKLGLKTFCAFLGTSGIAILIGWMLAVSIQPGTYSTPPVELSSSVIDLEKQASQGTFEKIEEMLIRLIPSNILAAAAQGQMLGLIFFCLLFGILISKIEPTLRHTLLAFWQGIFQVMMKMTEFVMLFLPIGVFGLVAKVMATTGLDAITSLAYFFLTMVLGLTIYTFIALNGLLKFVARVFPFRHMRNMIPAFITGFSTSSSVATLPVSLECVEKKSGVSNRIASFALPLGTSLNLAGSSMQVIVSVFFITQVYGASLNLSTHVLVFFMTWLLSVGVAGIPSASLFSIILILTSIGFSGDGIGLVMAVERILDMFRTTVNIYSNSCCSVLVASADGEKLTPLR